MSLTHRTAMSRHAIDAVPGGDAATLQSILAALGELKSDMTAITTRLGKIETELGGDGGDEPAAGEAAGTPTSSFKKRGVADDQSAARGKTFAWLHVPKTASSFSYTLLHSANASLPDDIEHPQSFAGAARFARQYPRAIWAPTMMPGSWGHVSVTTSAYREWRGFFVGMFRDPLQRALSAYFYFALPDKSRGGDRLSFARYFQRTKGTAVKQLAGQSTSGMECNILGRSQLHGRWITCREPRVLVPNVTVAIHRLEDGFRFVGLTDFYNLSICLFHTMVPGPCRAYEFFNNNRGALHSDHGVQTALCNLSLADTVDEFDQPLYDVAKQRFWADVRQYELTPESCAGLCGEPETSFAFKSSTQEMRLRGCALTRVVRSGTARWR